MQENLNNFVNILFNDDFFLSRGWRASHLKLGRFAVRTPCRWHDLCCCDSFELKVKLKLAIVERGKNFILIINEF